MQTEILVQNVLINYYQFFHYKKFLQQAKERKLQIWYELSK